MVLRRHEDGVLELRVNGIFVMDDRETRSEELLAALQSSGGRVLVGGLGLGHTVRTLLSDDRVRQVLVAEIEPSLVGWMRAGLIPSVLDDDRVEVRIGDVRDIIQGLPDGAVDGVLLDVDNGPDYLVYADNMAIYQRDFLAECRRVLSPDGKLTVWSSTNSAALAAEIRAVFGSCTVHPIELPSRAEFYFVLSS